MYNLKNRAYFTSLGELRMLLADYPDNTQVCTIGVYGSYLHVTEDKSLISFDDEALDDVYSETDDNTYIQKENDEYKEHFERIRILGFAS